MWRVYFDAKMVLLTILWAFLGSNASVAQLIQGDGVLMQKAVSIIEDFRQKNAIPGLTLAVSYRGTVEWARGFGYADLENRVEMHPNALLRVASISKPITTTALGVLYEWGQLDLDAPIQKYVPIFDAKKFPITTRLVAGHLAGIRTYRGREYYSNSYYHNVNEALRIFQADTLLYKPGTQFLYSTYGYTLLGAVIQNLSGQEYRAFVRQRVFDPLGMYNTQPEDRRTNYQTAKFYEKDKKTGKLRRAPWVDNSNKWAGGGFLSTAGDIARFGGGLLAGKLLKKETLEQFFTSMKTPEPGKDPKEGKWKETGYGMGWGVEWNNGKRYVGHSGSPVGGSAILAMRPEKQLVISILCNLQNIDLRPLAYSLLELLESKKVAINQ